MRFSCFAIFERHHRGWAKQKQQQQQQTNKQKRKENKTKKALNVYY